MGTMDVSEEVLALAKGWKTRAFWDIQSLVIHRFGVPKLQTGLEVAQFFTDRKHGTGGKMPYHFFIREDGQVDQCLPVRYVGNAAGVLNQHGVQIALQGDFRKRPPNAAQWKAVTQLALLLLRGYHLKVDSIIGHTDVKGASADPEKICPGDKFNLSALRFDVQERLENQTIKTLLNHGIGA